VPKDMNGMGFFIYTGTASGSGATVQTIPHNLGQKPNVIIPILSKIDGTNTIDCTVTAATATNIYVTVYGGAVFTIIAGIQG
jgi:hypothetical protein